MEDQLEKVHNNILKFLQSKLDPNDHEGGMFYQILQRKIDSNNEKQGRLKRQRKKKD